MHSRQFLQSAGAVITNQNKERTFHLCLISLNRCCGFVVVSLIIFEAASGMSVDL